MSDGSSFQLAQVVLDGPYQPGNVTVSVLVPIRTVSRANAEEHPMVRAKRVKRERDAVLLLWPRTPIPLPCTVYLSRIAPRRARRLDDDNLGTSVKAFRDEIARLLGVDDGDARVKWQYLQEVGAWGVRLLVAAPTGGQVLPPLPRPRPTKRARAKVSPRLLPRAQARAGFTAVPNFIAPRKP